MTITYRHARRLPVVVAIAMMVTLLGCSRCVKRDGLQAEKEGFTVTMQADLSKLAVVAAGSQYLVGIDTTTFRMKAHIRWHGVQFDKLARLPDGGVLVVNERMGQSGRLYRLNPDCTLRDSVRLPGRVSTPFVHNDLVLMGGRHVVPDGFPVMIHQLDDLTHRKTFGVSDVVRQELLSGQGDWVFIPHDGSAGKSPDEPNESFVVALNCKTLDTVHMHVGPPLEGKNAVSFVSAASGDSLIILPFRRCRPILYDVAARRTLAYRDIHEELKALLGYKGISRQPILHNGMLTMLYAHGGDGAQRYIGWVKIRLSDLSIVEAKRVLQDRGAWFAGDDFHTFGRFYIIEANIPQSSHFTATFIDWRTGEVAGQCTVDMPFGYIR